MKKMKLSPMEIYAAAIAAFLMHSEGFHCLKPKVDNLPTTSVNKKELPVEMLRNAKIEQQAFDTASRIISTFKPRSTDELRAGLSQLVELFTPNNVDYNSKKENAAAKGALKVFAAFPKESLEVVLNLADEPFTAKNQKLGAQKNAEMFAASCYLAYRIVELSEKEFGQAAHDIFKEALTCDGKWGAKMAASRAAVVLDMYTLYKEVDEATMKALPVWSGAPQAILEELIKARKILRQRYFEETNMGTIIPKKE